MRPALFLRANAPLQAPAKRETGPIERRGRQTLCLPELPHRAGEQEGRRLSQGTLYYDACWEWHEHLSEDQQDFVTYVIDAFTNWGDEYAKRWAAKLPPAPRCPP
jgi:hypothetical protein